MNIINMLIPEPTITPIADVNAADEGLKFTVEGYVTSNASGYDQDTAFFDCIYIQDDTAGINLFPVAGDFHIGQKVRVTGVTGSYNGERELVVTDIVALDEEESIVEPTLLTAEEAMSMAYTGSLVKVQGKVTYIGFASDGTLETIMVEDATGTARVFIDGYIMSSYEIDVQLGDTISAIGLASITVDTEDPEGGFIPRLRVRNREEIVLVDRPSSHLIDINGDGRIDSADVLLLMRYCLGIAEISENVIADCDINGDGSVDLVDATLFQRIILDLY